MNENTLRLQSVKSVLFRCENIGLNECLPSMKVAPKEYDASKHFLVSVKSILVFVNMLNSQNLSIAFYV